MERSYLIQRLKKPTPSSVNPLLRDNPFAFGGGLVNGGLSKGAMDLLRPIFSFDYMGAAEFEFGAVPEALKKIVEARGEYAASKMEIPLRVVPARHEIGKTPGRPKAPKGSATIYTFCRAADREEVHARIRGWAGEDYNATLKESTNLSRALRPVNEWDSNTRGWLELNNGFFFFADRAMWEQTVALFTASEQATASTKSR